MNLPPHQPRKLPEGRYRFTVSKEPEKKWRGMEPDRFISVTFFFKAETPDGNARNHTESILPWDDKYRDILLAIGGEEDSSGEVHLSEAIDIIGKQFIARIKHEPDKDDPEKSWARISNIETGVEKSEDVPPPANGVEEDDPEIPF